MAAFCELIDSNGRTVLVNVAAIRMFFGERYCEEERTQIFFDDKMSITVKDDVATVRKKLADANRT